ncbi:hypothetical protein ATE67_02420 [Sphingopyxis sp. H050]|uniref:GntR family transcriptional regulator n=1 Tax=Sphingopyxis sp. H050 TaxID=1759072 RepID=UPI00073689A0|nr:GntR family transcriptional regulator [Sphingopyxis sp. H050]KTE22793.1 hypothetical protein ATE67_02420 [Sphingopyxis sp. H050]
MVEPKPAGRVADNRLAPDDVVFVALERIIEGALVAGARITERWIVDQAGVTHAQAREALHRLDKLGALTLSARRGATLIRPDHVDPSDIRPIWLALLGMAGRKAAGREVVAPAPVLRTPSARWPRYLALRTNIDLIGRAAGSERLTHVLQRLALQSVVGRGGFGAIAPDAVAQFAASVARGAFDEAALNASFEESSPRAPARDEATSLPRAVGSAIIDLGNTASSARTYLDRIAKRLSLSPTAAPSTSDQLASAILQRIQFGEIRPGEAVRELPLAQEFGVSRGPVRDALRALDRQGIIDIEGRRGAFVQRFAARDVADLFEIRATVSGVQMAEAAIAPDRPDWIDDELRAGAALLDEIAHDPDSPLGNYIVVRRALAMVTLAAGGNIAVGRLAAELEGQVSILWTTVLRKSRQVASARTWRSIVEAIISRDASAARYNGQRIVEEAAVEALSEARAIERRSAPGP